MFKDKFECYRYYKHLIEKVGGEALEYKEINYGLQFKANICNQTHTIRIYESAKRGVNPDFSQVKDSGILKLLGGNDDKEDKSTVSPKASERPLALKSDSDSVALIGTDESGKGDYFGPLVIAGVYADERIKSILKEIGVDDSKKLKDSQISEIAKQIKEICIYDVVAIGNSKYNELYSKFNNLNKLLAWGHARVIENILENVDCDTALSDQFGSPDLIENALMEKGKKLNLEQRHRAEENVVVAAASILARHEFVECMEKMSKSYGIEFPKGASNRTIAAGNEFANKYGIQRLSEVAKLHFKTTERIGEFF